jgi:hypothetical protein
MAAICIGDRIRCRDGVEGTELICINIAKIIIS